MTIATENKLSHLTSGEIEELYTRYLNGEKNKDLVEEYKIDTSPGNLISLLPPIEHKDKICPYCETTMFSNRKTKSTRSWNEPPIVCPICAHMIYTRKQYGSIDQCTCENCRGIAEQHKFILEVDKHIKILSEHDPKKRSTVPYSKLTFEDKLILLTLFRIQTDESFAFIQSNNDPEKTTKLSPTEEMDYDLLRLLYRKGVIIVDPDSDISAFDEEEDFKSFYLSSVQWLPNISFDGETRASLGETFKLLYNDTLTAVQPSWSEDVFKYLYQICREEVMQYLYVKAEELNINFSAEKKTREVVNKLLHNFSVSEIYYFVKKSVENAHIYYSKGFSHGKKHAANTIPGKMLELGERALTDNWNVYKFSRDSRAPRSAISQVFFDLVFQSEDVCFETAPGKYWEQQLYPKYFSGSDTEDEFDVFCESCGSLEVKTKISGKNIKIECLDCAHTTEYTIKNN